MNLVTDVGKTGGRWTVLVLILVLLMVAGPAASSATLPTVPPSTTTYDLDDLASHVAPAAAWVDDDGLAGDPHNAVTVIRGVVVPRDDGAALVYDHPANSAAEAVNDDVWLTAAVIPARDTSGWS